MTQNVQWEFAKAMLKIQFTMLSSRSSRDEKRKTFCKAVDGLSEGAFSTNIPNIIEIINKKKDICEVYENSETQVDGILEWLPRMKEYRELLTLYIQKERHKYGLKE